LETQGDERLQQALAAAHVFLQSSVVFRGRQGGRGLQRSAVRREDFGIDPVGLGPRAPRLGKVAHLAGVEEGVGDGRLFQGGQHPAFVAAGGFAEQLHGRGGDAQQLEEPAVAGGSIGQFVSLILEMELKGGLVDVQAGVDRGRVVLTHTCKCELALQAAQATVRVWSNVPDHGSGSDYGLGSTPPDQFRTEHGPGIFLPARISARAKLFLAHHRAPHRHTSIR